MGFNISGIAISRNYRDDFDRLTEQYGWKLVGPEEVIFEEASSNYTKEDICNVYFTDNGTLIMISMERCIDSMPLSDANTMTFVLSEMTGTFVLNYCEGHETRRSIFENEGDRSQDEGEPLSVEASSGDVSEVIWNQMEVLLGESFHSIDLGAKALRYRFVAEKRHSPPAASPPPIPASRPEKAWWQFWK